MSENKYNGITERYEREIQEIHDITSNVKKGRYYGGNDGTNAKGDGSLANNMDKIDEKLNELLAKIENDRPSERDIISRLFKKE